MTFACKQQPDLIRLKGTIDYLDNMLVSLLLGLRMHVANELSNLGTGESEHEEPPEVAQLGSQFTLLERFQRSP